MLSLRINLNNGGDSVNIQAARDANLNFCLHPLVIYWDVVDRHLRVSSRAEEAQEPLNGGIESFATELRSERLVITETLIDARQTAFDGCERDELLIV